MSGRPGRSDLHALKITCRRRPVHRPGNRTRRIRRPLLPARLFQFRLQRMELARTVSAIAQPVSGSVCIWGRPRLRRSSLPGFRRRPPRKTRGIRRDPKSSADARRRPHLPGACGSRLPPCPAGCPGPVDNIRRCPTRHPNARPCGSLMATRFLSMPAWRSWTRRKRARPSWSHRAGRRSHGQALAPGVGGDSMSSASTMRVTVVPLDSPKALPHQVELPLRRREAPPGRRTVKTCGRPPDVWHFPE